MTTVCTVHGRPRTSFRWTAALFFASLLTCVIGFVAEAEASPPQQGGSRPQAATGQADSGAAKAVDLKAVAAASGPPVTVTTRLEPDPSHVGDLLKLTVMVAHPAGYSVNLPTGLRFKPLHLVSIDEGPVESTGQALRKTFTITLQAFLLDKGKIPKFSVTYVDPEGQVATISVPAKSFTVERLLANEAAPSRRGEDPLISLEYPADRAELVIYSVLLAALIAALATMLWMRHRAAARVPEPKPVEPPHRRARRQLDALDARVEDLFAGDMQVLYYLELTEIAKQYLQGRFGVEALDRTTEEIRRSLVRGARKIEPLSVDEIMEFLNSCDLVKFARYAPQVEQGRAHSTMVRSMIDRSEAVREAEAKAAEAAASQQGAEQSSAASPRDGDGAGA